MSGIQADDGLHKDRAAASDRAEVALLAAKLRHLSSPQARGDEIIFPPVGRPRSLLRRGLWWMLYLTAWITTLALSVLIVLRVFNHDGSFLLIWLNAFTRYLYLPAYVCLMWAAWQRRWILAAASSVVVACHIALMAPDFVRDRRFDSPAQAERSDRAPIDSPTLRIFFANVAATNTEHNALLQEIAEANPHVIVLVEYSMPWHLSFKTSPIMASYIHGSGLLKTRIGSVNVFSKLPLENETQNWVVGRGVQTVEIKLRQETLRIIGLHAPRPIGDSQEDYPPYWGQMVPLLSLKQGPLVVVGDFNATEHSLVYKRLTSERLRSAHDDRGRGYATTWPNGQNLLPPIRIDQILLSAEVECERVVEGRGVGSDHKPVIADVRIRSAAAKTD